MFKLTLVTPEKRVVTNQEIEEVTVPANKGELNILPGHAPLITTLSPGVLKYKVKNAKLSYAAISWGYCQVSSEGVNILAETVETSDDVDLERAEKSQQHAETSLLNMNLTDHEWVETQKRILRSKARQELAKLKGS
jgi:F-type H+-transporting ATPase subunit epsilon